MGKLFMRVLRQPQIPLVKLLRQKCRVVDAYRSSRCLASPCSWRDIVKRKDVVEQGLFWSIDNVETVNFLKDHLLLVLTLEWRCLGGFMLPASTFPNLSSTNQA